MVSRTGEVTEAAVEASVPEAAAGGRRWRIGLALGGAVALVAGVRLWGMWLRRDGANPTHLGAAYPLAGDWRGAVVPPWLPVPVAFAVLALWGWPRLVARLSWRWVCAASFVVSAGWAVALALTDGPAGLTDPLAPPEQYPHDVGRVGSLATFLRTFNRYVVQDPHRPTWTTHVGGHPPGALGVFVVLDRIGLHGLGWAAAVCIAGGALAAPCVLATVRLLGGEEFARRAALFVPLAPAALWIATSADALFAGVAAAGVLALTAASLRTGWRGDVLAAAGGLALGCCLFLSYGLALYAAVAAGVVLVRRRVRPLVVGGVVVLALLVAARAAGFDWLQGLGLAAERTRQGLVWQARPTAWFLAADPAALLICVGPAAVAGLALLRRWSRVVVLPVAVALAVVAALVSNLSKGEVERIWLPFAVWLVPFAGLLVEPARRAGAESLVRVGEWGKGRGLLVGPVRRAGAQWRRWWSGRGWLAAQLGVALVITATIRTWW